MSPYNVDVVTRRLSAMRDLLDHLEGLAVTSADDLADLGVRLQVERVLTQVVNLSSQVNAHVAAARGRPPQDYREGFDAMADIGLLPRDLAASLRPSVGLRNVLTHQYVDVDLDVVASAVPAALKGYRAYIREVAARMVDE